MPRASKADEEIRSNNKLCLDFAMLLTARFEAFNLNGEQMTGTDLQLVQAQTKKWRGALWKEFLELEGRLCPRAPLQARPDYAAIARASVAQSVAERPAALKEQ